MRRIPGELLMTLVAVLWGSAFPVTRILLDEMPPLGAAAWRTLLAAGGVFVLVALRGELRSLWPVVGQRRRLAAMALLGGAVFLIGMNVGIALTGASISSFVVGTYPLLAVAVAALALGERVPRRAVIALGVALIGLVLLARPGGAHVEPMGVLAALGAALSFAVYLAMARRWTDPAHLPPLTIALALLLASMSVTGAMQLVLDPAGLQVNLSALGWASLAWLALPASALPHVLVVVTVQRIPASRAAPFLLLIPIAGALISAVLLNERLDAFQLVGAGLILVGVGAATIRGERGSATPGPSR